jgi:phosphinothricin acetyltransferase
VTEALVRPSEAGDLAAIAAIYGHHVLTGTGSFEEEAPDAAELARRRAAVLAEGLPHVVAAVAGSVVGFAYAGPYRARPAYRLTCEDSVYVAPGRGGHGLGRALLAAVIAAATTAGRRQMVAVIGDSGNAGSIALHAALGFRTVGTLVAVGFKHGRWVDTVLMQRPLGPGDTHPPGP